ncbi:MAG: hypothetical protein IAF02_14230 [Anaerolineae bacterium]|nr:hypothetical protein [Anaerolineae bacterium]
MTYQEKNNLVSLISTLVIFGFYFFNVYEMYQAGVLSTIAVIGLWVPVIIFTVVVHVVFNIINAIATNHEDTTAADERDKLIELKSTRNSHYLFLTGFFISMGFLMFSTPPLIIFNLLILAFVASEIFGYISQLYYYRKGF